jgi:calcineurin-like phosphoesterase family protein
VSSFLKNTLSNYFEVELPDDQVYSKQTRSIKQRKNKKENKRNRIPGIERLVLGNDAKDVVVLIHTYKRGEVSNPLGVSLEAQT